MARKKTPNVDSIIGIAEDFINGGEHIGLKLDFTTKKGHEKSI